MGRVDTGNLRRRTCLVVIVLAVAFVACSDDSTGATNPKPDSQDEPTRDGEQVGQPAIAADVTAVQVSGEPGAYTFAVTVSSPDTGCDQYADWWEVISAEGQLIYRRVLLHSHASEQPFTRTGGPVEIQEGEVVWVRAHVNNGGYGGAALSGSVDSGFTAQQLDAGFAAAAATQGPLPVDCDF